MMPTNAGLNNESRTGYSFTITYPQPAIERKPCPFCKCNKTMTWHIGHYDKPWLVECMECSASGPHADTEEEAIELWNRRANE